MLLLIGKDEVLQDLRGVHARATAEPPWGWLQEPQEDHENMQDNLSSSHQNLP